MNTVDIREHSTVNGVPLTSIQRDALLGFTKALSLQPARGQEDGWNLTASSFIGSIIAPQLTVRISPKLTIARLFTLLSASGDLIRWSESEIGLAGAEALEDVIAMSMATAVERALRSGALRGYVTVEEEAFVVRGRLDLPETMRRHPATLAPFVQAPEYFETDTAENRIIATALHFLTPRVQSASIRVRLVQCQRAFHGVPLIRGRAELPRVARNRLNSRWWPAVELALLILQCGGLDLPQGQHAARAFLVNMNSVFERFVRNTLQAELGSFGYTINSGRFILHLDEARAHRLKPDLSVWSGDSCIFVGDCKYKRLSEGLAPEQDLYQCLAYAAATGLRTVMLIYAGDSDQAGSVRIVDGRTTVAVRTIDLAAPAPVLRAQFTALAAEIAQGR